jgi:hypothetical protein
MLLGSRDAAAEQIPKLRVKIRRPFTVQCAQLRDDRRLRVKLKLESCRSSQFPQTRVSSNKIIDSRNARRASEGEGNQARLSVLKKVHVTDEAIRKRRPSSIRGTRIRSQLWPRVERWAGSPARRIAPSLPVAG